ncbi:MAG: hypothetical protein ACJ798_06820 [Phenylobacterium sp.]
MKPAPATLLALVLALAAPPGVRAAPKPIPPASAEAVSPTDFLTRIYARYRRPIHAAVDYLSPPEDRRTFEPGLVSLIHREQARHAEEPIDWLSEADIFCECQDFEDVRAKLTLGPVRGDRAEAAMTIADLGFRPKRLGFVLVRTPAGWRIWDLIGSDGHSLRRGLEADLARPRHRGGVKSRPGIEPRAGPARPIHDG